MWPKRRRGPRRCLFTDVVGSTALRIRLGDAAADDLMRRHERVLADTVTGHGGSLVKGLGDGIMATFGGAADAVLAAIAIQREIRRPTASASDDRRFEVRVGISAGDVTWDDGDCHGTPVVTASRLCNAADGGQIICDDLVRGLARGRTDLAFSVVGELTLKGLARAGHGVRGRAGPTTRADDTTPLPAALRAIPGELPFAGRDAERRRLADAWKQAQVDGATVVLVSGEPGVGKTRLASELARAAHDDGGLVLLGRCDEHVSGTLAPVDRGAAHAHRAGRRAGAARARRPARRRARPASCPSSRTASPTCRRRRPPTPRPNASCCSTRSSTC